MRRLSYLTAAAVMLSASTCLAAGELHIYNWGDYASPPMIEKFSKEYDVKVTVDAYDSNETMLSKVRAGGSGYDVAMPSDYTVKIMVDEGMLERIEPASMQNFKNLRPDMINVYWDEGRHYSVPWMHGLTAFAVDTAIYKGDIDTYAILFDPPKELQGRINMLDDMNSVMHAAERYLGFPRCTADKTQLKQINDLLNKAKPHWRTFSYDGQTLLTSGDVDASMMWNGNAYRVRLERPTMRFAYPKEGVEGFMDNVVVLKDAPNLENAKLFVNFMMDPQNAGMNSDYNKYDNGVVGSDKFMPADFAGAPEIKHPDGVVAEYVKPCPAEVVEIYNKIWTNLRK